MALPLSAGRMVRWVLSFSVLSAALSVSVRLSLVLAAVLMILTVSFLASSVFPLVRIVLLFSHPLEFLLWVWPVGPPHS